MWKAFYLWEADSWNSSIKFHGQFYFPTRKNIDIIIIGPRETWLYQGQTDRHCEVCHKSNNNHPQRPSRMQISPFHLCKEDHESNEVETDPYDTLSPPLTTCPEYIKKHLKNKKDKNSNNPIENRQRLELALGWRGNGNEWPREVRTDCQYFPGGPVVKTPSFHCRGPGFDPWSGN